MFLYAVQCLYIHTYTTYVKGILSQGGKASEKKLKDTDFNFTIINDKHHIFSIFCTDVQIEDIKLLDLKSTSFLYNSALFLFAKIAMHSIVVETVPSLMIENLGWEQKMEVFTSL